MFKCLLVIEPWLVEGLPSHKTCFGCYNSFYVYYNIYECKCCLFVCLFLLLYVPSQQLWSLRDGQFT